MSVSVLRPCGARSPGLCRREHACATLRGSLHFFLESRPGLPRGQETPIPPLSCLLGPGAHAAGFRSFPVGRRGRWRCLMPVPRGFPSPSASPLFLCSVSPAGVGARAGLCSPGTLGPLEGISSTHSGDSAGVSHPHCLPGPGGWHLPQQESVLVMGFMTRQRPW